MIVRTAINLVGLYARVSAPIIPFTAEAMASALGEPWPLTWPSDDVAAELSRIPAGRAFTTPPVLFKKIEEADLAVWAERFGGAA